MDILEAQHLTFRYFEQDDCNILENASLNVKEGAITVLLGSSGCGKSTLAAVCAGLFPANAGELLEGSRKLCGRPVEQLDPAQRSRYLSMMFQNPDLQFCMDTLRKELIFCFENQSLPPDQMAEAAGEAARRLSMEPFLDRRFETMSGGEKQKAALCCLLALNSKVIILDEPFANIDPDSTRDMIRLLKRLNQTCRTTIIAIDHQPENWLDCAHELILLGKGGRIVQRNITADNIQEFRRLFEAEGVACPGLTPPACIRSAPGCPAQAPGCPTQAPGGPTQTPGGPAVQLNHVSIRHSPKGGVLLKDMTCTFCYGQLTAVTGRSGSGKTTLFHTLLKQKQYEGAILVDGKDLGKTRERELFQKIGMVFQNPSQQFTTTNVLSEILESLKVWQRGADPKLLESRAEEMLRDYGLWEYRQYSPYMLSQGQQRRLAVLSMQCGGQKILLLDEPTYGQDSRTARVIMEQLREKAVRQGLCVIFSTHDHQLAHTFADVVCTIEGKELNYEEA